MKLPGKIDREKIRAVKEQFPQMEPDVIISFIEIIIHANQIILDLDRYFGQFGLSNGRFRLLMELKWFGKSEEMSPAELSTKCGVRSATITGLLNGLEKDGLIERSRSGADRRRVAVKLTKKGHSFISEILPKHYKNIVEIISRFSREERTTLKELIAKMSDGIKEKTPSANKEY